MKYSCIGNNVIKYIVLKSDNNWVINIVLAKLLKIHNYVLTI